MYENSELLAYFSAFLCMVCTASAQDASEFSTITLNVIYKTFQGYTVLNGVESQHVTYTHEVEEGKSMASKMEY